MLRSLLLALLTLLPCRALAQAPAAEDPFRVEIAGADLPAGGAGQLEVILVVPEDHHVYRDMIEVRMDDPQGFVPGELDLPLGVLEPDPAFPEKKREMYHETVTMVLAVTAPAGISTGEHELDVQVRYQGCRGGLCYLPREQSVPVTLTVVAGQAPSHGVDLAEFGARPTLTDDDPVGVRVLAGAGEVRVGFFQAEGWHVNQTMTFIELKEGAPVQAGAATFPPAHAFTDPNTGMERQEIGGDFLATLALTGPAGTHQVPVTVGYQACKANLCLMPRDENFTLEISLGGEPQAQATVARPQAEAAGGSSTAGQGNTFEQMRVKGLFWLVLFVFGAGFLVSLTPCVLPMIPITIGIIGARASGSRMKAFSLSLTYVAGLALVYTALGITAALTGSLFGGWMQNIWVVGSVSAFFAAMGLAMFGIFDVAMPSGVSTKLNQMGGAGYAGAFVVGMVGAVVAGPCSGPVVVSLMVLVGAGGELMLGVALMLAFSLGMGVLFLVAGIFSSALLRPGPWMESVKRIFGVIMLLGAIYFIHAHLPDWATALLTAAVLLSTAIFGWPRDGSEGFVVERATKLYAVVAGLVGAWLLLGLMATHGFILPPLQLSSGSGAGAQGPHIEWLSDEPTAVQQAQAGSKPLIIDFTAEWCAACQELEHFTYSDATVIARAESFVPVMFDATDSKDPQVEAMLEKYDVKGLPTVVFVLPDGTTMDDLTVTGFVNAEDFLGRMDEALTRMD